MAQETFICPHLELDPEPPQFTVRRISCQFTPPRLSWTTAQSRPLNHFWPSGATNLTLACKAHNAFAAEQDFGRDFMQAKRAGQVARAPAPG